ncbi:hypothetical protein QCA50_010633 [Cerrena zonata]|uniref:BTB domain-containing protein n=1 Tax=Cerrena zonata TaxID=2478898 RepID=A0AAW0G7Y9_9APHY
MSPSDDTVICSLFNAKDADIIIRSFDGIHFRVYRRDLEAYSEGFVAPPCGNNSPIETVQLSETSGVLKLLLQFMRKQRQPDIKDIEFELLADLAEAAEKYEVYAAIQLCNIYMRNGVSEHPLQVLSYATKHGYADLANECAIHTIGMDVKQVLRCLPPNVHVSWLQFHLRWQNLPHELLRYKSAIQCRRRADGSSPPCTQWSEFYARVAESFARKGLKALRLQMSSIFLDAENATDLSDCSKCMSLANAWRNHAVSLVNHPKYTTFSEC